jgi:hypothetical protein
MAISGTVVQSLSKVDGTAPITDVTIATADGWSTPTAGNILVACLSTRSDGTVSSFDLPSGFTAGPTSLTGTSECAIGWKISDGTETSFTAGPNYSGSLTNFNFTMAEFPGTDLSGALDGSSEVETYVNSSTTSLGVGTVNVAASSGLAIAIVCTMRYNDWALVESWTDSYTEQVATNTGAGGSSAVFIATKVLSSSGNTSTTFSTTDSGSTAYGAQLVFAASAAGGPTIQQGINQFGYGAGSLDGVLQS